MFNWFRARLQKKPDQIPIDYDYSEWKPVSRIFRPKYADVHAYEARTYIYIYIIEVDKKRRKQGIGSSIMKRMIWYAERFNKDIVLEVSSALGTSIPDLFEFYEKHGFKHGVIERINYRHNMVYKVWEK